MRRRTRSPRALRGSPYDGIGPEGGEPGGHAPSDADVVEQFGAGRWKQRGQERSGPGEASDERVHGVVAGPEAEDGPGEPQDA